MKKPLPPTKQKEVQTEKCIFLTKEENDQLSKRQKHVLILILGKIYFSSMLNHPLKWLQLNLKGFASRLEQLNDFNSCCMTTNKQKDKNVKHGNTKLIDSLHMLLKSYDDILSAFNHMLSNGLETYHEKCLAPFMGDWPTQFFKQQLVYNSLDFSLPSIIVRMLFH